MTELIEMRCVPCRSDSPQTTQEKMQAYLPQIPNWQVVVVDGENRLKRAYKFKNFAGPLAFTQQVGELAEAEDHHPQIVLEWGKVTVSWWTHSIGGLHRNDFVMAARCDKLYTDMVS